MQAGQMWAAGVPLEDVMTPSQLADVRPILTAYSYMIQCKNLGLTVNADSFDPMLVIGMHTVQEAIETVRDKQRNRGAR